MKKYSYKIIASSNGTRVSDVNAFLTNYQTRPGFAIEDIQYESYLINGNSSTRYETKILFSYEE